VWSKFIYPKAKVRVTFGMKTLMYPDDRSRNYDLLCLSATNMGPGEVTLHSTLGRNKRRFFRRGQGYFILNPLISPFHTDQSVGPFSGGLPKKMAIGESFSVFFVPNHTALAADGYDRIGFSDTFGRLHWAKKADISTTKPFIRKAIEQMGPALA
jgi:hypothetical protein